MVVSIARWAVVQVVATACAALRFERRRNVSLVAGKGM
jgi:hypothetical protein